MVIPKYRIPKLSIFFNVYSVVKKMEIYYIVCKHYD
jgi:hypothetical protein